MHAWRKKNIGHNFITYSLGRASASNKAKFAFKDERKKKKVNDDVY